MTPQKTKLNSFEVMGIKTRTTNAAEMSGAGKIASLWQRFYAEQLMAKIPHQSETDIFGIYHEYESDFNSAYSLFVGMKVPAGTPAIDGLEVIKIPEQNYLHFKTDKGEMPNVVVQAWQKIWAMEQSSELKRKYSFDLEVYSMSAMEPANVQADIFIATP